MFSPTRRATDDTGKQTVIRKGGYPRTSGQVTGVVSRGGLVRCLVSGDRPARRLLEILESHRVESRQFLSEGHGDGSRVSLLVPLEDAPQFPRAADEIRSSLPDVELSEGLGAVSLVGETINDSKRNLLTAMEILEQEGIPWFGVDTTSYRITFLTKETELDRTVRRLHARFVETALL